MVEPVPHTHPSPAATALGWPPTPWRKGGSLLSHKAILQIHLFCWPLTRLKGAHSVPVKHLLCLPHRSFKSVKLQIGAFHIHRQAFSSSVSSCSTQWKDGCVRRHLPCLHVPLSPAAPSMRDEWSREIRQLASGRCDG